MDEGRIELRLNGQRYAHWQECELRESVEDLCAAISLRLTLPGAGADLGLDANTKAQVLIEGALVATVRADSVSRKVGASSHTITFTGRSLARELVDCTYSKTLSGLKLGDIVKRLCTTFEVPVKVLASTAVVKDFAMQCESPSNALINAARSSNTLLHATPDGGLVLTEPDVREPICSLVYGADFVEYELLDEHKERFSDYCIKAFDHQAGRALTGTVQDAGITYFRPMQVVADKSGHSAGGLERRATLERNRRLARSKRLVLHLPGWRYTDKAGQRQVWPVNRQVRVVIAHERVDGVYLIGERSLRMDAYKGRMAVLTLMHREAYLGQQPKQSRRAHHRKHKGLA